MKTFHITVSLACAALMILAAFILRGTSASTWVEASLVGAWLPIVILKDPRSFCRKH